MLPVFVKEQMVRFDDWSVAVTRRRPENPPYISISLSMKERPNATTT